MLLLVFGFFYQSYQEMRKIAPVQVAVERITGSAMPDDSPDNSEDAEQADSSK
jgi:hypothetical protein